MPSTNKHSLNPSNHSRDSSGMRYVYPVLSRRAGGISIGINLNPNNACNWRCLYCQVPGLTRGNAPTADLHLLEQELRQLLSDWTDKNDSRQTASVTMPPLQDIAFSGNGEPTSSDEFAPAVAVAEKVLRDFGLLGHVKLRLITNGSLIGKPGVLEAITHLARCHGEVWFKLDAGNADDLARINGIRMEPELMLERLRLCAAHAPTWVQTCLFALDGQPPDIRQIEAYVARIQSVTECIQGIHLYSLARPSMQPEAPRLERLSAQWMTPLAKRLRAMGIKVCVNP